MLDKKTLLLMSLRAENKYLYFDDVYLKITKSNRKFDGLKLRNLTGTILHFCQNSKNKTRMISGS